MLDVAGQEEESPFEVATEGGIEDGGVLGGDVAVRLVPERYGPPPVELGRVAQTGGDGDKAPIAAAVEQSGVEVGVGRYPNVT